MVRWLPLHGTMHCRLVGRLDRRDMTGQILLLASRDCTTQLHGPNTFISFRFLTGQENLQITLAMVFVRMSFSCDICPVVSVSQYNLKRHKFHAHEEEKKYICSYCGYKTSQERYYQQHLITVHLGRRFICDQCDYSVKSKGKLNDHIRVKHMGLRYTCSECDKSYNSKENLKSHQDHVHEGIVYACEQCDRKFPSWTARYCHVRNQHKSHEFKCNECDKQFSYKHKLEVHVKVKHRGLTFDCNECEKKYNTKDRLKIHKRSIHEGIVYACEQCDGKFKTWMTRYSHVRNVHLGEKKIENKNESKSKTSKTYSCSECDKEFKCKKYLDKHLKTHLGMKFQCDHCNKKYSNKHKLKVHIEFEHLKTRTFLCDFCKKSFSENCGLIKHQLGCKIRRNGLVDYSLLEDMNESESKPIKNEETLHLASNTYSCSECDKEFKCRKYLDKHLKTHLGMKFQCDHCDKKYSNKHRLKVHLEFEHLKTRTFLCDFCKKSFSENCGLIKHQPGCKKNNLADSKENIILFQ